jgi:type IV pilus assembly protein PilE
MSRRQAGFTLVELMITVAIVGILAAVAYPSYAEYVRRTARADAQSDMAENVQFLERVYTSNNRYDRTMNGGAWVTLPVTQSPRSGTAKYNFAIVFGAGGTTYTLTALPQGSQALDKCAAMSVNQAGVQAPLVGTDGRPCW